MGKKRRRRESPSIHLEKGESLSPRRGREKGRFITDGKNKIHRGSKINVLGWEEKRGLIGGSLQNNANLDIRK